MKAPIITWEPNDLCIFDSVEDAELYYEEWIIDDDEIIFYDADGYVLIPVVGIERRISLRFAENNNQDIIGLRAAICRYLIEVGEPVQEEIQLSLEHLIEQAYDFAHTR